jgi:hypothetical protein
MLLFLAAVACVAALLFDKPLLALANPKLNGLIGAILRAGSLSAAMTRGMLDSLASRLDGRRDLLIFLGLLGRFWGLLARAIGIEMRLTDR